MLPFSCGRWPVPWLGTTAAQPPHTHTLGHVALLQQLRKCMGESEGGLERPSLKDCSKRYGLPQWHRGEGPPAGQGMWVRSLGGEDPLKTAIHVSVFV